MIKVGIIGGAGYTAGELIRLLIHHAKVELVFVQSKSHAKALISSVHKDLFGESSLSFSESPIEVVDLVFLCKGHGESLQVLKQYPWILKKKVIDLSQDFRSSGDHQFMYGLPESNTEVIRGSQRIANPGCFATAIQLALLPAIDARITGDAIHISGITGSTGAGQSLSATSHFSWRSNNATVYKALQHQHIEEVRMNFESVSGKSSPDISFIPYRGAFTRGIITTSYFDSTMTEDRLLDLYSSYYEDASFTHVVNTNPDLKMVVNTNKCVVHPQVIEGKAIIIAVIDNLLKGAVGQAIQNMNIMCDFDEHLGLELKASAF
ncbi:MAG: N-acetyl-gamma-glutamyl-phosphate reductase [Bacteroidota bacterium]